MNMDVHNYFMASILFCIIFGIYFFTLISHTATIWIQNWVWIFHFGFFLFNRLFMCIPFVLGKRGRERKYKLIIIRIGRSICCLMLIELALNTSLKHFVLTKSMCWLAFERKNQKYHVVCTSFVFSACHIWIVNVQYNQTH